MSDVEMAAYCGDDYPRAGCKLEIDVTTLGYGLTVFAPNGARLETYGNAATPWDIGRMVTEWCSGKMPRLQAEGS